MAANDEEMATHEDVDMDDEDDAEGSSSDESGSSSDEDENAGRIDELQKQIAANEYVYDPHVELIRLLRQSGELDALREARRHMSAVFPLTESLWLEWLQDEIKVSTSDEEKAHVMELFEKAFEDYLSPGVWLEYVQHCIGLMASEDGLSRVRAAFERAVSAVGLHPVKGAVLWEAYREFENALLSGMQPSPGAVPTAEQQEQIAAQSSRVDGLFRRQLSVPLMDMQQTLSEYRSWLDDGEIPDTVMQAYESATQKLQRILPLEKALLGSDPPPLEDYHKYIEQEVNGKDPSRIRCIYERAVQDHCLNADLWMDYAKYTTSVMPSSNIYERAVRNCPWSAALWLGHCRSAERQKLDHQHIQDLFQKALAAGYSSSQEYLQIWTARLDYLRRRVAWTADNKGTELEDLRAAFQEAVDFMEESFPGGQGDPECSLLRYWARLEARHGKGMARARELWSTILRQRGFGSRSAVWTEYTDLERAYGDHAHCHKIFCLAVNSVNDWPEGICEAFIRYEGEEGSLEDYEEALSRCEAQMERIKERRHKAEEKAAASAPAPGKKVKGQKRPISKVEPQSTQESAETFKVPAIPLPSDTKPSSKPKIQPPPGFKPRTVKEAGPGAEPPAKKVKGEDVAQHVFVPDGSTDNRMAFVSNLSYDLKEDRLKEIFSKIGEVTGVHLVKNYKGLSKGYAYVEFKDELMAQRALTLDRQLVEGRPMFVSECNKQRQQKFKFATSLEKNKLFVRGLPLTVTREALENVFRPHGALRDVRLATFRSGAPKGIAYVEYENEADAAKAVTATDGLQIGDKTISVAISNPPDRKQEVTKEVTRAPPPRGKSRTQLSLVPRSLQRKPASSSAPSGDQNQSTASEAPPTQSKMSNADFRKFLLK